MSNEVNYIHFSEYFFEEISENDLDFIEEMFNSNDSNDDDKEIIETVYSEGNINIDPYKLIVDSGCPKTVTGRQW